MEALYAFFRHTDDLGDDPALPADARREALSRWRESLACSLSGQCESNDSLSSLILPAVVDAVRRFSIPQEHLLATIEGVEMDLNARRYETFDELAEYCHRVASAVGLACVPIWGVRGDDAWQSPARACGLAFQLTNILRDVKEDAAMGRFYLPQEGLRASGYSWEDLQRGVADDRFERWIRVELDRARHFYQEGCVLFDRLEPDGRRIFGMMLCTYRKLLEKIARRPSQVLEGRVRLSRWQKLRIAARWAILPPRRLIVP